MEDALHCNSHGMVVGVDRFWVVRAAGWAEWLSGGEKGFDGFVSQNEQRSESAPLRKSTGRVAISTRTPGGTGITAPPSPPAARRADAANPRPARRGSRCR